MSDYNNALFIGIKRFFESPPLRQRDIAACRLTSVRAFPPCVLPAFYAFIVCPNRPTSDTIALPSMGRSMGKDGDSLVSRTIHRLTSVAISNARTPGLLADGGGLYFRVAPGGSKGWIFRFRREGRTRDGGLGAYPAVGLAKARELAAQCRRSLAAGVDPIDARQAQRRDADRQTARAITFSQCAENFISSHEVAWRNPKHRQQWRNTIKTYAEPNIGSLIVAEVDTTGIVRILEPIWTSKPETASRLRGRLECILDWARARGYREGENPARWRGHLDHLLPPKSKVRTVQHHAAMPYLDVPGFMRVLTANSSPVAQALTFLILTSARTTEVTGAEWNEISFGSRSWEVPASRMKSGRSHRVALSRPAITLLQDMAEVRQGDFIFPGARLGTSLSSMAMAMLLRRLNFAHVTVHGFRSSFRTFIAEATSFPSELAEMALAHVVGSAVERAYLRGDLLERRREVAEVWATFCMHGSTVVPLRAAG